MTASTTTESSTSGVFVDKLLRAIDRKKSHVVVGLDPNVRNIPQFLFAKHSEGQRSSFALVADVFLEFNKRIIDAVEQHAVAIKPQIAFYEQYLHNGIKAYVETVRYAKQKGLLVIGDVKRNDIGSTAKAYSAAYLGEVDLPDGQTRPSFNLDAITVNPYLGFDGIRPFINDVLAYDKGVFVLVKTSNPSSRELQDLYLQKHSRKLYEHVGSLVDRWGENTEEGRGYKAVGAVVGATYSEEARSLRRIMPKSFFLVPGYGAQGATAKDIIPCFDSNGYGAIINAARSVIYAYQMDPWKDQYSPEEFDSAAEAAAKAMKDEIVRELHDSGLTA